MGALINLKAIKSIRNNESVIKTVYLNNEVVYRSDEINPSYNYFVFNTTLGDTTTVLELSNYRRGDNSKWDGLTDWGDGTIDSELSHTYENHGIYTVKTKWTIHKVDSQGIYIGSRNAVKMLIGCDNINKNITDVSYLFYLCRNLKRVDMSRFRTNNITDMSYMFDGCYDLETLNMKGWNTSNVTNTRNMFRNCEKLTPKVSHFNMSNVIDAQYMFYGCKALDGSQFLDWRLSSANILASMFQYAVVIENELNLSRWHPSANVLSYMFFGCRAYEGINISYWNIGNNANVSGMLSGTQCSYCNDVEHHVKHSGVSSEDWERMKKG